VLEEFSDNVNRDPVAGLYVPLIREREAIGMLALLRNVAEPYVANDIALVEAFADQAVIAIENARLFAELEQRTRDLNVALEQQTATAEVLRVIASAPTDLQAVLAALVENAAGLCGATGADIVRLDDHGWRLVAAFGTMPAPIGEVRPVGRGTVPGRAMLERRTVHVPDLAAVIETEYPDAAPI
jgi:GAF domain-containing protein